MTVTPAPKKERKARLPAAALHGVSARRPGRQDTEEGSAKPKERRDGERTVRR